MHRHTDTQLVAPLTPELNSRTKISDLDAGLPVRLRIAAHQAKRSAARAYEAHELEQSAQSYRAALESAYAARDAEYAARNALQSHREALAQAAQDTQERNALSFQDLILLALAVRRETPHLSGPLGIPGLRFALILAAYLAPIMLALSGTIDALKMREYLPPPPDSLTNSPVTAARTLELAPGAPSRAVCV